MFLKYFRVFALLAGVGLASEAGLMAADASKATTTPTAPPPAKSVDLFGEDVIAKGKSVSVKRSELDEAMVNLKTAAVARGQNIPPQELQMIEQQVLDRMIQIQLLMAKATDADKAAGKQLSDQRMDMIKERAKNEDALNRQLKLMGTSQEELRSKMNEESTAQTVLERELSVKVNEDEVKKYYDENPAKFEQPEMVHVSHILFATKDLATGQDLSDEKKAAKKKAAEDVLKRARSGEDFSKLVKEFSDDTASKDRGGEYTFARASADPKNAMVPEFENASFSMKTNEVSDLVQSQFGYHIIKLLEKIPARKLELAKVSPDIKEYLKSEQLKTKQQEYQTLVTKLKKDANVEILDDKLKLKEEPPTNAAAPGQAGVAPATPVPTTPKPTGK